MIKIGLCTNLLYRLGEIQSMSPDNLKIIGVIENVGYNVEQAIHLKFNHCNSHGEWFYPTSDLLAFIKEHSKPFDSAKFYCEPHNRKSSTVVDKWLDAIRK